MVSKRLERDVAEGRSAANVERLADLEYVMLKYVMLMGLYVTVKGGVPLQEINRLCGIAIDVMESWRIGAK